MSEQTKAIQTASKNDGTLTPAALKVLIKDETERRKLLADFIKSQLVEGVDYGKIHIVAREKCPQYYSGCTNKGHFSKDTLFKAGAEKFTSLFHLRPVFYRDTETWETLGNTPGTFCFRCELVASSGEVVAEGRGACSVSEKYGNVNNAIKIAEKRAQLDAVLRHGGLSDVFTQDLEDTEDAPEGKKKAAKTPPQAVDGEIVKPVFQAPVKGAKEQKEVIYECVEGAEVITKAEFDYSKKLYGRALCRDHQKGAKK